MNILGAFKQIKVFVLDVDGVLTDGCVLVLDDGQQVRRMNIKDGYGLQLAIKKGYKILIISGGTSEAVRLRLQKLGITDIVMGVENKKKVVSEFLSDKGFSNEQWIYMGDDIPDLEVMKMAGLASCPADAVPEIKKAAHYVSSQKGGEGCVRDIIEKVLKLNGDWDLDSQVPSR